ncbi:MAG: restriction endonuclease subunit S [Rhodocyclaceae bacterium]|nr:restriction endonuclease subunit S [Rhodocyclaceae bacterium]
MEVREPSAKFLAKPTYKQTEAGEIPEDWEVHAAGDIGWFRGGNGFPLVFQGRASAEYPFFKVSDMNTKGNESTMTVANNYISESTRRRLGATAFPPSTIVFAKVGAAVFLERKKVLRVPSCIDNNMAGFVVSRPGVDHRFIHYFLLAFQLGSLVSATALPSLSGSVLKAIKIPLPSTIAEQQAISEALSNADALIESLEQLLAKKRQIKQGAVQELLTGNKRLPGFAGEWKNLALGEVAPLQRGFDLPNGKLRQGPYPVVYSNGVLHHHKEFQVKGPGVVTGRSGTIGAVTFVEQDYWPHNTSLWVTSFKGNDPKFVFFLYTAIGLERFATGSGVPTLNRNDVHASKVSIPPTRDEQTAIATLLSDMDAELAALEAKLAKARQIKQGMMQELLTGRIRLV